MNSFKIWINAQLYNIIIVVLLCFIASIYQLTQNDNYLDNDIGIIVLILILFIFFSFIGGLPLIWLFKLIEIGIENSQLNKTEKSIIEIISYPLGTLFYLVSLSFLLSINDFNHIHYDITLGLSAPAIISTLISVLVNQYQIKKNKDNENNIIES